MFKEYEVVFRATVMTTGELETNAIMDVHYRLSSALDNVDGLLVGYRTTQTLPTATIKQGEINETTDTTEEDQGR